MVHVFALALLIAQAEPPQDFRQCLAEQGANLTSLCAPLSDYLVGAQLTCIAKTGSSASDPTSVQAFSEFAQDMSEKHQRNEFACKRNNTK